MFKAKISGTQVGENTMNRKLTRVCTTYYDVICVKQKSAPNIQYKDKEAHEKVCKYRPYICPYIECDHKLAAGAVVDHVSSAHREECRRSDGPEITASMILIGMYFGGDGAWSPRVITCFGKTFFDVALTRDTLAIHIFTTRSPEERQCSAVQCSAVQCSARCCQDGTF